MIGTHLIALLDHHLLSQEDLLRWDLHAQVSSRHHDGIRLLQNVVKILDAFLIFYFADDLDLPAPGSQHLDNAHTDSLTHTSAHEQHQNIMCKGILNVYMH